MYNTKKKYNKKLDEIGKQEYRFNFYSEKIVYKDLCCLHLSYKERKEREKLQTFNLYREWKTSIINKYKDFDKEKMIEFSRYLNQRLRNKELGHDYWKLAIPVILTLGVTDACSMTIQFINDLNVEQWDWVSGIVVSFVMVIFMVFIFGLIWNTMDPIWESRTEKNFLIDFKEIIDECIVTN